MLQKFLKNILYAVYEFNFFFILQMRRDKSFKNRIYLMSQTLQNLPDVQT